MLMALIYGHFHEYWVLVTTICYVQFEHWQVVQIFGLSPLGALTIQQVKKGFGLLKKKSKLDKELCFAI